MTDINKKIEEFHIHRIKSFETQILHYSSYIENKDILDIGSNIGLISINLIVKLLARFLISK